MSKDSLRDLAALFLRLGVSAFGGPAAHIALMKEEVVVRRRWMTEAEFLDLLGAANLVPGPNSTELAIHIGLARCGWIGLVLAGVCFILPAALIVTAIAWAYVRFGALPPIVGLLYAVKPVVLAVVVQAIWGLVRSAVKSRFLGVVGAAALALALLGVDELALLLGSGALAGAVRWWGDGRPGGLRPPLILVTVVSAMVGLPWLLTRLAPADLPFGIGPLFLFFLKVGATLYGSGYVLVAFLRDGLVARWHWLTGAQLLDAVAVGQVTPGPVFTTATFIGYVLGGFPGALAATVGIFLPAFGFVAVSGRLIPLLRRSPLAGAFLDGVNVAALVLMAAVTWTLARAALVDTLTVGLAALSALLLVRFKVNATWLILGAAALGVVRALV